MQKSSLRQLSPSVIALPTAPSSSSDLGSKLRQHLSVVQGITSESPWKYDPVPFVEFVTSKQHMRFPDLSPKQLEAAHAVLNHDPKKTFDTAEKLFDVVCCLWGKGSLAHDELFMDAVSGEIKPVSKWAELRTKVNVRTYDFENHKMLITRAEPFELEDIGDLVEVATEARYTIRVSVDHKFYDVNRKWKPIKEFKQGEQIATSFGLPIITDLKWTRITNIRPLEKGAFYGVTVPKYGNYFHNNILHQNSGKDSLAAIIVCYISYILLCLKDPYKFLTGYSVPDEAIDIVNVAYSYDQANNVFFTKLKSRVKNWYWLRKNFRVRESGKDLDPKQDKAAYLEDKSVNTVVIYPASIMFPNMIRAFSRHSLAESTEGLNILSFVLDEASAMKDTNQKANADKLYEMLTTSAQSRFPNKWFGFVLSWPRHRNDFTMKMYTDAIAGKLPRVFASRGATWEVNPTKTYEDFKEALTNPKTQRDSEAKYACNPPAQEAPFIEFTDKIQPCVRIGQLQVVSFEETLHTFPTGAIKVGKVIKGYNAPRRPDSVMYVARVDLGETHDSATLTIAHEENGRAVVDVSTHWEAKPKIPIDVDDPAEIIIELKRNFFNIVYVTFDQWNSASSINRLNRIGIQADKLSLNIEDYKLFRDMLYGKQVDLPDYPKLTDPVAGELANLQLINNNKVDHPGSNTNDLSEGVVGVTAMLFGTKKNVSKVESTEGYYKENEKDASNSIWTTNEMFAEDHSDAFSEGVMGVSVKLH